MKLDFSAFRKQVQTVSDQVRQIKAEVETAKRERDELMSAPAAKSDLKTAVRAYLQAQYKEFETVLQAQLQPMISKPEKMQAPQIFARQFTMLGATARADSAATPASMSMVLCGLIGPALADAYCERIDALQYEEGPTLRERQGRIQSLDTLIGEREAQLEELLSSARAAGLLIEG